MDVVRRTWLRVLIWAIALGLIASLLRDWGDWAAFPVNFLWRFLITAAGGVAGVILNVFAGAWVAMGTNVVESLGTFRFSDDRDQKVENGFIFVCALVGALVAWLVIR